MKIARRNISNFRYADNTTLMAESEEELRSLLMKQILMKVKEENENVGLSSTFRKLTSWHLVYHFMVNKWGNSERLCFWGLQNHCRW